MPGESRKASKRKYHEEQNGKVLVRQNRSVVRHVETCVETNKFQIMKRNLRSVQAEVAAGFSSSWLSLLNREPKAAQPVRPLPCFLLQQLAQVYLGPFPWLVGSPVTLPPLFFLLTSIRLYDPRPSVPRSTIWARAHRAPLWHRPGSPPCQSPPAQRSTREQETPVNKGNREETTEEANKREKKEEEKIRENAGKRKHGKQGNKKHPSTTET